MRWPFMLKSVHELILRFERERFDATQKSELLAQQRNNKLIDAVMSQHKTIARLQQEVNILTGAKRVRTEQEPTISSSVFNEPDVRVMNEEDSGVRYQEQVNNIRELERELEERLAALAGEIDTSNISEAAKAEAYAASPEEWRSKHNEPPEELPLAASSAADR